jgi:hypothetical protein
MTQAWNRQERKLNDTFYISPANYNVTCCICIKAQVNFLLIELVICNRSHATLHSLDILILLA